MFLTSDLMTELSKARTSSVETQRFASLEADLAVFVQSPALDPKYLYRLFPPRDCVWEIRSTRPDPQIRVLGLFAEKDVFVATHHALRSDLGLWDSAAWRIAKRRANAEWWRLFSVYQPKTETDVHQLVSGAINGKYFTDFRAH